jgi:hypothetical protein
VNQSDFGVYRYELKDGRPDGREGWIGNESAWIYCQPTDSELAIVGEGHLSIRVQPGTPYEKIAVLAKMLDELGARIEHTPR